MNIKTLASIILSGVFILIVQLSHSQQNGRPKIGLTLSGGGAKGLAHIGILRALDSAGLEVDFVTGTSMGAVVGSLYATGYSGDTIYQIAKELDWNALLLNRPPLNSFLMEHKNEYGRYAVEIPAVKGRVKVPSGILEAEELWLKFNELFYPVYNIQNFDSLPRGFRCIATDIVTGEAVVLDQGSLLTAVRASMAIPSIFTAVDYNDSLRLVDGGIIRNFPVRDVKDMGANIIIGSTVAIFTNAKAKDIATPMQILLNVAFFRENEYSKTDLALCDYLIKHPLSEYSTGSFTSGDSIMAIGNRVGDLYYPLFKKIADSLNSIYGKPVKRQLPAIEQKIKIRHIVTDSLKYIGNKYLMRILDLKEGNSYSSKELETSMRHAYGTRYFSRIYYRLQPIEPGVADLYLVTEEFAPASLKLAIHYNAFSKIMLIANFSKRDMIGKNSVTGISIGVSENPRLRLEHTVIMGSKKVPLASVTEFYAERQEFSQFRDFKTAGDYRQLDAYIDTRVQLAYERKKLYGLGLRAQAVSLRPTSVNTVDIDGSSFYMQPYLRFEYNTHDRLFLPRKGTYILIEPSLISHQSQKNEISLLGVSLGNIDTLGIDESGFIRLKSQIQHILKLRNKHFITLQGEADANFNTSQLLYQDFVVGGIQPVYRNQVSFAGLQDGALRTNSLLKAAIHWRYNIAGNLYIGASINAMYHSFLKQFSYESTKFLSGYGLAVGIDTPFGPVEFNLNYCDQAGVVNNTLNAGFRFSRDMF
jgi:NTE family protein